MSAGVARQARAASPARVAVLVLAGAALIWLLLFQAEAVAAIRVWSTSTAYGHCYLVLPVAAYLAWERRAALDAVPARAYPLAALAGVPLAAAWLVAALLGVMEGRQLMAVALLLALALAVLGPRLWWACIVPLLYLFFLVPFGGFLVGPLQQFTAQFIDIGLDLLGIPHLVTQLVIEIPEGTFRVAEACAGLRFLIAAIAFGVVYACTLYRGTGRRLAFIAVSLVVPVVANGVRALGIVLLGHLRGSAEAGAVDHILYGWIFFSIVLFLLILAGLPFREDFAAAPPRGAVAAPSPALGAVLAAAAGVLLLSAAPPAAIAALAAVVRQQQQNLPPDAAAAVLARLATPDGCSRVAAGDYVCDGVPIRVSAQVFAPRSNPALLNAARLQATEPTRRATQNETDDVATYGWTPPLDPRLNWDITRGGAAAPLTATALWAGTEWQGTGLRMRLRQARAFVLGGRERPILVTVEAAAVAPNAAAVLQRFLGRETTALFDGGAA